MYRSINDADSWTQINEGLASLEVNALAADDTYLYAGGTKLYRRRLSEVADVRDRYLPAAGSQITSISAFPNPATSQIHLQYTLPERSSVSLAIFDAAGRMVCSPVSHEAQERGEHHHHIGVEGLEPGVYSCRIVAGGTAKSTRFIVVP